MAGAGSKGETREGEGEGELKHHWIQGPATSKKVGNTCKKKKTIQPEVCNSAEVAGMALKST